LRGRARHDLAACKHENTEPPEKVRIRGMPVLDPSFTADLSCGGCHCGNQRRAWSDFRLCHHPAAPRAHVV